MKSWTLGLAIAISLFSNVQAQPRFLRALGGVGQEEARQLITTPDGNFIGVGYIQANGYVNGTIAAKDGLIFKINPNGNVLWAKAIGGNYDEEFNDVVYHNGYYYCVGYTNTWIKGGTVGVSSDIFLVKIKGDGTVAWAKNFGNPTPYSSTALDVGNAITETAMGVMLTGMTQLSAANSDVLAVRVADDGKIGFIKHFNVKPGNSTSNTSATGVGISRSRLLYYPIIVNSTDNSQNGLRSGFVMTLNESGAIKTSRRVTYPPATSPYYKGYVDNILINPDNNRAIVAGCEYYNSNKYSRASLFYDMFGNTNVKTLASPRIKIFAVGFGFNTSARIFQNGSSCGYLMSIIHAPDDNQTQKDSLDATVVSLDTSLNIIWKQKFGWSKHDYLNKLLPYGSANTIYGVGGARTSNPGGVFNYNVLLAKFNNNATQQYVCGSIPTIGTTITNYTNDSTLIGQISLDTTWAGNSNFMPGVVTITSYLQTQDTCIVTGSFDNPPVGLMVGAETPGAVDVAECPDSACIQNLKFTFHETPVSVSLRITDENGYIHFYTRNQVELSNGFKFSSLNLSHGRYRWEMRAPLVSGAVEVHEGEVKIE